MHGEDHPAMAEGEDGPFLGGPEGIVMLTTGVAAQVNLSLDKVGRCLRLWVSSPDMASGLAGKSVIDGGSENLGTEGQQEIEDAATEVVEIPAGLAEEAVKRAVVFEVAQLARLNDTRQGPAVRSQSSSRSRISTLNDLGDCALHARNNDASKRAHAEKGDCSELLPRAPTD